MKYDLEERASRFGENILIFLKKLSIDYLSKPIVIQLIRSATSIGANYMEANQASSEKDFYNKISISQKESNETKHWIRMLAILLPEHKEKLREFWKEAHELTLIFASISRNKN
jgi:four helix bundle protein